jgi:hypothetical protein
MLLPLSRWRPGHLLAVWSAYWLGLAAAVVTPIALTLHRLSRTGAPPNTTDLSLNLSDKTGFTVAITQPGHTGYHGSAGLLPTALAIGVPPLLLWGAWLFARTRTQAREAERRPAAIAEPIPVVAPARERESEER